MEPEQNTGEAPERVLSFNELEQQLRDMPVEYGETPLEYPTPQPEEAVSPAESEPATESSETEASPAEELETFTVEAVAEALQMDPRLQRPHQRRSKVRGVTGRGAGQSGEG